MTNTDPQASNPASQPPDSDGYFRCPECGHVMTHAHKPIPTGAMDDYIRVCFGCEYAYGITREQYEQYMEASA